MPGGSLQRMPCIRWLKAAMPVVVVAHYMRFSGCGVLPGGHLSGIGSKHQPMHWQSAIQRLPMHACHTVLLVAAALLCLTHVACLLHCMSSRTKHWLMHELNNSAEVLLGVLVVADGLVCPTWLHHAFGMFQEEPTWTNAWAEQLCCSITR